MKIQHQLFNTLLLAIFILLSPLAQASYWQGAKELNQDCDGVAQLPIGSMTGTCVGLVASNDETQSKNLGLAFKKPRKALELSDHRLLVTDMGGWSGGRGILWLLTFSDQSYGKLISIKKLLSGLNLPHDIKLGDDGFIYLGEADRITRFKMNGQQLISQQDVITQLPYDAKDYRHPLTSFVFMENKDLLINIGSRSDNCGLQDPENLSKKNDSLICDEDGKTALLRRYAYISKDNRWSENFEIYADGLRNSVALLTHSSGTVLQAENSSDIKSADEPYEEINVIQAGGFYGWPYCLNRHFDLTNTTKGCRHKRYIEPISLIPPHTAPLDMIYYPSSSVKKLPMLAGKLLMSWHGYRVVGNRLVAYDIDHQGLPLLSNQPVHFMRDPIAPATQFTHHTFKPKGDSENKQPEQNAQAIEVIGKWNKVKDLRPEGAPVGLLQLRDGAILIVDDKNKALLRLSSGIAYNEAKIKTTEERPASKREVALTPQAKELFIEHCSACHSELISAPHLLLNAKDGWLRKEQGMSLLKQRLTQTSGFMPPTEKLKDSEISTILNGVK